MTTNSYAISHVIHRIVIHVAQVSILIIDLNENSHTMTAAVPLYNVLQYLHADFRSMQSLVSVSYNYVNSSLHLTYYTALLKSLHVTSINESINYFLSTMAVYSDKFIYMPCFLFRITYILLRMPDITFARVFTIYLLIKRDAVLRYI